jgi:hypothetical protein
MILDDNFFDDMVRKEKLSPVGGTACALVVGQLQS